MRLWWFTETPYPFIPDESEYDSIRVTLPNEHYDPKRGADLWHMYLDMWCLADEVGLDLMVNEHHQTPTCLSSALTVSSSILARETKSARILQLGNPVGNRRDPVRVAEETALVDVISRGRLDVGFIRGVPFELSPANSQPNYSTERIWEAHDLIKKAWTTHDGPFNFEGEFFHYRQVNIWPRPYQEPHPPIWFVAMSPKTNEVLADYGYVTANFLLGWNTRPLFDVYRRRWREIGHTDEAPPDRFAPMFFVYVADTEELARKGAEKLAWYMTGPANRAVPPQFFNPPGFGTVDQAIQAVRGRLAGSHSGKVTLDDMIAKGLMICGTPDTVYEQIVAMYRAIGFGHILGHCHAGFMEYEETARSIKLLGEEVMPRLKNIENEVEIDDVSVAATGSRPAGL